MEPTSTTPPLTPTLASPRAPSPTEGAALPTFVAALSALVNDRATDDAIAWTSDGRGVAIVDRSALPAFLARFFASSRVDSFQRQLSNYGFRSKLNPTTGERFWVHPHFVRGDTDQLFLIHRRRQLGDIRRKPCRHAATTAATATTATTAAAAAAAVLGDRVAPTKHRQATAKIAALKMEVRLLKRKRDTFEDRLGDLRADHAADEKRVEELLRGNAALSAMLQDARREQTQIQRCLETLVQVITHAQDLPMPHHERALPHMSLPGMPHVAKRARLLDAEPHA